MKDPKAKCTRGLGMLQVSFSVGKSLFKFPGVFESRVLNLR